MGCESGTAGVGMEGGTGTLPRMRESHLVTIVLSGLWVRNKLPAIQVSKREMSLGNRQASLLKPSKS